MDKDIIQILWSALLIVIVTIVPLVKKFKEMQRKELRSASAAQPVRRRRTHPPRCPDSEKRPASPQKLKKRNLRYATRSAYPERTPNSNLIAPVSPKNSTCEKRSFIRR